MTPRFVYGTAWKEDRTADCVELALMAGFRAIDTANQRKHYHEAGVGEALRGWTHLRRDELWLQTKFTFRGGQDHRLPYVATAPIAHQVRQSFASSLEHLGVDRLDSYVLHGPSRRDGLGPDDREAWGAMEELARAGRVDALGISNVSRAQLAALLAFATVRPTWVQNRCYARTGWDADVRALCAESGIRYQGFSLLTANREVWQGPVVAGIAAARGWSAAQVVLRYAIELGITPLTGTTDPRHMRADLDVLDGVLTGEERRALAAVG